MVLKLDSSQNITEVKSRYPGNYIMYEKLTHLNRIPEISDPESAEDIQHGYWKILEDQMNLIEEVRQEKTMEKKLGIQSYLAGKNAESFTDFFDLVALPQHVLYKDGLIKDLKFDLQIVY